MIVKWRVSMNLAWNRDNWKIDSLKFRLKSCLELVLMSFCGQEIVTVHGENISFLSCVFVVTQR